MTSPIAIQLYSVRELMEKDFEGVIRRIAEIGYVGVETAGFPDGVSAAQASALFSDLGLTVAAGHMPLPLGEDQQKVIEMAGQLGLQRIISAYLPPEEYRDAASMMRTCARLNEAQQVTAAHGFSFGVHNHWWEFEAVDGVYPYQVWLEELDPAIFFELDTYWIQSAGIDPLEMVRLFGERAPLIHIKDGPAGSDTSASMVAAGEGAMDYAAIVSAGAEHTQWLIVELDRCATDMMVAVEKSYQYLVQEGLGHGR